MYWWCGLYGRVLVVRMRHAGKGRRRWVHMRGLGAEGSRWVGIIGAGVLDMQLWWLEAGQQGRAVQLWVVGLALHSVGRCGRGAGYRY